MKKSFINSIFLYPILFPINLVLTLAAANLVNLTNLEITVYVLAIGVFAGLILAIGRLLKRDMQRTSFLLFIFTIWAAYFGVVTSLLRRYTGLPMNFTQQIIPLVIWSACFGFIGSRYVWKKLQRPELITTYLNVLAILLIALSIYRIQVYKNGLLNDANYKNVFSGVQNLQAPLHPPDIYYIILDGYGQQAALSELYGWDNSEFIDFLSKKGFYIASQSQANYVQTGLSVSSSLNFDYLPNFPETSRDGRVLVYLIQHNRLFKALEDIGYSTYAFQTPYEATNITQVDHYFAGVQLARTQKLLGLLMLDSVVSPFVDLGVIKAPLSSYKEQQHLILTNLSEIESIATIPGPKLVFLHLLIPHPPFIFNESGPLTPDKAYILTDADLYEGSITQYIQGYVSQANYLNQALVGVIDNILATSATTPIIILQGDHGPGSMYRQTVEQTCLQERFGILNAYLLPGIDPGSLYPTISPVNTFRLILDAYFKTNFSMLPDKHYYSNFIQPYKFVEITGQMKSACK